MMFYPIKKIKTPLFIMFMMSALMANVKAYDVQDFEKDIVKCLNTQTSCGNTCLSDSQDNVTAYQCIDRCLVVEQQCIKETENKLFSDT